MEEWAVPEAGTWWVPTCAACAVIFVFAVAGGLGIGAGAAEARTDKARRRRGRDTGKVGEIRDGICIVEDMGLAKQKKNGDAKEAQREKKEKK